MAFLMMMMNKKQYTDSNSGRGGLGSSHIGGMFYLIKKGPLCNFWRDKNNERYLFDDDHVGEDFPMKTDESLRLILL